MAYKPTILQVKDPSTGQWIPIPAITGGDGRSAYQVAVDNGYTGTEAQWIESLKGENGVSIQNISGNADGSWTITYTNGTSETISNGAYISLVNELQRAKHTTMAVEITDDGFGGYNSSVNDNDINNHRNAGGVVFCYYHNSANNVTYTYWYSNMEPDRKPTFLRTYIDEAGKVKQVLISVDNAKKATVVFRTASVPIDPTLTQPNQAADAKAVGDALDGKQPVDGEWELIEEFKTDALATVDKTKEPDGTPYHFSAVRVKVTYAGEEKNNISLSFYAYDAGLTKNKSVGGIYVPLAASEGTLEMATEIDGGRWKTIYNPASDPVAAFYKPMLLEKTSQEISAAEYNHVGKIACWDVIQPNTTFRIEAVRAKE